MAHNFLHLDFDQIGEDINALIQQWFPAFAAGGISALTGVGDPVGVGLTVADQGVIDRQNIDSAEDQADILSRIDAATSGVGSVPFPNFTAFGMDFPGLNQGSGFPEGGGGVTRITNILSDIPLSERIAWGNPSPGSNNYPPSGFNNYPSDFVGPLPPSSPVPTSLDLDDIFNVGRTTLDEFNERFGGDRSDFLIDVTDIVGGLESGRGDVSSRIDQALELVSNTANRGMTTRQDLFSDEELEARERATFGSIAASGQESQANAMRVLSSLSETSGGLQGLGRDLFNVQTRLDQSQALKSTSARAGLDEYLQSIERDVMVNNRGLLQTLMGQQGALSGLGAQLDTSLLGQISGVRERGEGFNAVVNREIDLLGVNAAGRAAQDDVDKLGGLVNLLTTQYGMSQTDIQIMLAAAGISMDATNIFQSNYVLPSTYADLAFPEDLTPAEPPGVIGLNTPFGGLSVAV